MSQGTRVAVLVGLTATAAVSTSVGAQQGQSQAQSESLLRRAKSKAQPVYPELARKMNIVGTVKVEVVVLPNGVVKDARVVGGHPLLANAATDAAKKWRFEPAAEQSSGVIDFKFEAH